MCISYSYCYFSVIKKQRDRKVTGERQKSLSACRNQSLLLKLGCDPGFRTSLGMIPWRPHCMPRLSKRGINQPSGGAAHNIHRGKLVVWVLGWVGTKRKKFTLDPVSWRCSGIWGWVQTFSFVWWSWVLRRLPSPRSLHTVVFWIKQVQTF